MNDIKQAPIGVFDSGVGGLTVVREIMRNLPTEKIVYFGDTARVPYGSKSKETVLRYSRQIVRFLRTQEVKAIVVACNTASAMALEEIKEEIDIPIIGVVRPGAKVAAEMTENKRVGIIGTQATVGSQSYRKLIQEIDRESEVIGKMSITAYQAGDFTVEEEDANYIGFGNNHPLYVKIPVKTSGRVTITAAMQDGEQLSGIKYAFCDKSKKFLSTSYGICFIISC